MSRVIESKGIGTWLLCLDSNVVCLFSNSFKDYLFAVIFVEKVLFTWILGVTQKYSRTILVVISHFNVNSYCLRWQKRIISCGTLLQVIMNRNSQTYDAIMLSDLNDCLWSVVLIAACLEIYCHDKIAVLAFVRLHFFRCNVEGVFIISKKQACLRAKVMVLTAGNCILC